MRGEIVYLPNLYAFPTLRGVIACLRCTGRPSNLGPLRFIGVALLAWFPVQVLFTTWLQFVHPPRIILYASDSTDLSLIHSKKDDP